MTEPGISSVSPFFIVHDGVAALSFYRDQLGFDITYREPADVMTPSSVLCAAAVR